MDPMREHAARIFWGKARPDPGSAHAVHPAWAHGLDVAAAGRALLRARPRAARALAAGLGLAVPAFEALWLHLLALHDIGKFSPLFQAKVPAHCPAHLPPPPGIPDPGHPAAGLRLVGGLLMDRSAPSGLMRGWNAAPRNRLLQPIFGHHGRPAAMPQDWQPEDWRPLFPPASAAAALAYWGAVEALLPAPEVTAPSAAAAARASWPLAGLTALADWIGSNQAWFPYASPEAGLAAYWDEACGRAEAALREAGLVPARPGPRRAFAELTGLPYPPTAIQAWAETVSLPDGPLLILIEDVTGGGKTEAALMLAHRLLAAGRADGLYLALPTTATANAMVDRILPLAGRLYAEGARPSLALAHGRAGLHPRFRAAAEGFPPPKPGADRGEEAESAAVAPAWLAGESRRALLADLGVGTIDQAVLAVLPNRYGTVRLAGLAGKVLIVDEAHAYDAYVGAQLARLVAFHAAGGGTTLILSATLPSGAKAELVANWRRAVGSAGAVLTRADYPLATLLAPGQDPVEEDLAARADLCRILAVTRVPDRDAALARIRAAAEAGACIAWIRNSVDDAVEGAAALRAAGLDPDLFHARFAMGDRLAVEDRVRARFGKTSMPGERRRRVLVATQVAESSLDLDFDLVVTDLAPVDAVLQRAGRLWRHTRGDRPIPGPELVVVSPDPAGPIAADWAASAFPRGAHVYRDHAILWRTARELTARPAFRVPEDVRPVIEAVFSADESDIPKALKSIHFEAVGRAGAERATARGALLDFAAGYWPDQAWPDEGAVPTRLAEESRTVRLARVEGGRLVPWHPDPELRLAWALSEVTVALRKLRGHLAPVPGWHDAAAAVRAGWSRFDDAVILLPLEPGPDGTWQGTLVAEDGGPLVLTYGTRLGLML
ncbi:CRISPR-associated helicase/endonuclease Cas3 [Methylobacterium frigidaeris]|uniref:CRISPR-associated endonuclease/helicase Cas3 n=1 Tax=Methylobacterium frigidaeris TaxID=2038277 RepID=A0AA37HH17_9HYPH|nr:CRISPR-associated helicase/endonuclease Cas3 [Methylobacterium frigidaeris]PIK70943.1 CRISPR-associated helicase/endonuclease Cas3 [Methylobacterium frigidaeris]GJD65404.1 CRISPR-associated endonuclease/helicase Cas3 [Methylobacterium frigidaeris]